MIPMSTAVRGAVRHGTPRRADFRAHARPSSHALWLARCWVVACMSLSPRLLGAQWLPALMPPLHQAGSADSTYQEVPAADVAFLGMLGGAVGCVPGALAGGAAYEVFRGSGSGDDGGLAFVIYGCLVGVAVGLPTAVHLAIHGRGNFWLDLLVSAGIGAIGFGVAAALEPPEGAAWLIPLGMVGFTVAAEKHAEHLSHRNALRARF
jgi:hypothetical protein